MIARTFLKYQRELSFAFLCVYFFFLCIPEITLGHFDLGWHIRAGELYREKGQLLTCDPWSHASANYPWLNPSWLWEIFISYLYEHLGFSGIHIFSSLQAALIFGLIMFLSLNLGASLLPSFLASLLAILLSSFYALPDAPISASVQTVTLLFSLMLVLGLLSRSKFFLCFMPILFLLWQNIQGGYLLGLAVLGLSIMLELFSKEQDNYLRLKLFSLFASIACFLLNPLLPEMIEGTLRTLLSSEKSMISEWQPLSIFEFPYSSAYLLLAVICAFLMFNKVPRLLSLLVFITAALSFTAQRHLVFFFCISAPVLALALSRLSASCIQPSADSYQQSASDNRVRLPKAAGSLSIFLCLGLFGTILIFKTSSKEVDIPRYICPLEEVTYLQTHYPNKKLFNDWNLGSCLIYRTQGVPKIFVDGRAMTAYPPELIADLFKLYQDHNFDYLFDKYGFEVAIVPSYRKVILDYLDKNDKWRRDLSGSQAVVFVKK